MLLHAFVLIRSQACILNCQYLSYTCLLLARFKSMHKLIHYANLDGRINVLYSTPSRYVAAKHACCAVRAESAVTK